MYPEMKYHGMKDLFRIVAIPLFAWAVWASVVCCLRWQKFDGGTRIFMLVSLCIPIAGLCYVFSRLRHPSCYAELRADGLHVFSKESGELAFIDWNDVTDYRLVRNDIDAPHITYDLLIFRRAAPFGAQSISMLRKYRMADVERIARFRLDEQMEKLHEGTMTAEEFKNLPYLFLVTDYEFEKNPVSKTEKLWRARRMACRAAVGGGDNPDRP